MLIYRPNIEGSRTVIGRSRYPHRGELTQHRGEQHQLSGGATPIIGGSNTVIGGSNDTLPTEINVAIRKLGARPRVPAIRAVILSICTYREWSTTAELAAWLDVKPAKLTERHLSPLVKEGTLIRRYPDTPTHQSQAYRSGSKQASLALTAQDRS